MGKRKTEEEIGGTGVGEGKREREKEKMTAREKG